MKDRDGRPAVRDPTFLAETQMMKKDAADRLMGETARQVGEWRGVAGHGGWRGA